MAALVSESIWAGIFQGILFRIECLKCTEARMVSHRVRLLLGDQLVKYRTWLVVCPNVVERLFCSHGIGRGPGTVEHWQTKAAFTQWMNAIFPKWKPIPAMRTTWMPMSYFSVTWLDYHRVVSFYTIQSVKAITKWRREKACSSVAAHGASLWRSTVRGASRSSDWIRIGSRNFEGFSCRPTHSNAVHQSVTDIHSQSLLHRHFPFVFNRSADIREWWWRALYSGLAYHCKHACIIEGYSRPYLPC